MEVEGDFEAAGSPASNIIYRATVNADASEEKTRELMMHTDTVAEIQNTIRATIPVKFDVTPI